MANLSLRILNKNSYPIDKFIHYGLIPEYKKFFRTKLNPVRINLLNEQLKILFPGKRINSRKILLDSLKYMIVSKDQNSLYVVQFDNNQKIPYLDIKYIDFIYMLTYGTSAISKWELYIESFDFIRQYYTTIRHRFFGG